MTLFGTDISHWQTSVDYGWLGRNNVDYLIAKCTDGLGKDRLYDTHVAGARKSGMIAGAYHWLQGGNGAAQADYFIESAGHVDIYAVDCEDPNPTYGTYAQFANRFAESGKVLFTYTGISYWRNHMNDGKIDGPLWMAYYPKGGYPGDASSYWDTKLGGQKPAIWQYGPGPFKYDGDAFRGSRNQLLTLAGSTSNAPDSGEPMLELSNAASGTANLKVGAPMTDYSEKSIGNVSVAQAAPSPFEVVIGANHYRAVALLTGGKMQLVLVHNPDAGFVADKPTNVVDCNLQVSQAVAAERLRIRSLLGVG